MSSVDGSPVLNACDQAILAYKSEVEKYRQFVRPEVYRLLVGLGDDLWTGRAFPRAFVQTIDGMIIDGRLPSQTAVRIKVAAVNAASACGDITAPIQPGPGTAPLSTYPAYDMTRPLYALPGEPVSTTAPTTKIGNLLIWAGGLGLLVVMFLRRKR